MWDFLIGNFQKGGIFLVPIIGVAVWGLYLAFDLWMYQKTLSRYERKIRKRMYHPKSLSDLIEEMKDVRSGSMALNVLLAIYQAKPRGRRAMENAMDAELKMFEPELEGGLATLGTLASSAPLLGLLGTVSGMVGTFKAIALFGAGNPAFVSDSIGEALLTTQNGLLGAIPLMLMHMFLTTRSHRLQGLSRKSGARLINFYVMNGKEAAS